MVAVNTSVEGYTRAQLLLKEGIEVVCGGFPCQDISAAGKGLGLAGSRSGLWREQLRTIRLVRPIYAIVENVAMLLNRGMGTVLGDLAESGYDAEWGCISARDVGAPHLRERIWIVAHTEQPGRRFGKRSDKKAERQPRAYADNPLSQGITANLNGERKPQLQGMQQNQRGRNNYEAEKEYAANDRGQRREEFFPRQVQRQPEFSWCEDVRGIEDYFGRSNIPEPLLRRGGDGISKRLHGLGNAVVPSIPRIIGKSIMQYEQQRAKR